MRLQRKLEEVRRAFERRGLRLQVADEQAVHLLAHGDDERPGVVLGEGIAFEPHRQRVIARGVEGMAQGENGLRIRRDGDARGAQPGAVGFEMHRDVLIGARPVILQPRAQRDGLALGDHERRWLDRGDREVLLQITRDAVEREQRRGRLLLQGIQRRERSAFGKAAPVGLLKVRDQQDFARGVAHALEFRAGHLERIVQGEGPREAGVRLQRLWNLIENRHRLGEQEARRTAREDHAGIGTARKVFEDAAQIVARAVARRAAGTGGAHGKAVVQQHDEGVLVRADQLAEPASAPAGRGRARARWEWRCA